MVFPTMTLARDGCMSRFLVLDRGRLLGLYRRMIEVIGVNFLLRVRQLS